MGVGPGRADLLTLRAVNAIKNAQLIICPRSASSRGSLALEIIRAFIVDQEVIEHVYPMQRSGRIVRDSWLHASNLIVDHCLQGKAVVQATLGDPHIYSTCAYVLPFVEEKLGADKVHLIPGITAFQACAANFLQPLTTQEDRLTLMPGSNLKEVEKALVSCETLILYKAGKNLAGIYDLLMKHGLDQNVRVVFNAEMPGKEKIYPDIVKALEDEPGYLACVIVYIGRRKWGKLD